MRKCFVSWYSERVAEQIKEEKSADHVGINLPMSVVKPLSANWFLESFEYLRDSTDIFVNGFKAAGIWDILNMHQKKFFLIVSAPVYY